MIKNESVVEGQWDRGYEEVKDCVLEESPASASPVSLLEMQTIRPHFRSSDPNLRLTRSF